MKSIFKKRYSIIDLLTIAAAAELWQMYGTGAAVLALVIGSLISVLG